MLGCFAHGTGKYLGRVDELLARSSRIPPLHPFDTKSDPERLYRRGNSEYPLERILLGRVGGFFQKMINETLMVTLITMSIAALAQGVAGARTICFGLDLLPIEMSRSITH